MPRRGHQEYPIRSIRSMVMPLPQDAPPALQLRPPDALPNDGCCLRISVSFRVQAPRALIDLIRPLLFSDIVKQPMRFRKLCNPSSRTKKNRHCRRDARPVICYPDQKGPVHEADCFGFDARPAKHQRPSPVQSIYVLKPQSDCTRLNALFLERAAISPKSQAACFFPTVDIHCCGEDFYPTQWGAPL